MEKLHQHQRHNIILTRLKNGQSLSIAELSREWNIPTKTIQRDFKKLLEGNYGIVRADDGKRFTLGKEKNILSTASTAIKMLDSLSADIGGSFYTKAQAALRRIEHYVKSPFYTRIDVENISEYFPMIEEIESAISQHRMISFHYKRHYKPDDIKYYTDVKPYKILIFDGFFYLFCHHKHYYPKFYLKEMSNLTIQEETFAYNETLLKSISKSQNIWFDPEKEDFEVTLYLDSVAKVYFQRKPLKNQILKLYPDGTAEVTISITDNEEVFSLMKKWLPHIKILEPIVLQKEFETILSEYVAYCAT
ncbi:MAG TPA: WYL domain-containing protein [Sulfurovum sp.]|nr:WYL domain-containing protein [Sulfurovum sp.]